MKPYNEDDSKKKQVRDMFDNIAPTYDKLNHILSINIDRIWRRRVVRIVRQMHPHHILDVATGTGDLAIAMARRIPDCHILGVDLSEQMLAIAHDKVLARGMEKQISLSTGDAEHLNVADGSVDVVTVAFGVRNFENLELGLREMHRTIKDGGHIVILEFSNPRARLFGALYRWYSHKVLPFIGRLISRDGAAYDYLPSSVDEFPAPERFMEMLREVGFKSCKARSQSFGIAQIYTAER
jgi:demethylmenaquinone methyltransferase/2-methoxy-6-polyprenyl-1,4-benzoquinol methylase